MKAEYDTKVQEYNTAVENKKAQDTDLYKILFVTEPKVKVPDRPCPPEVPVTKYIGPLIDWDSFGMADYTLISDAKKKQGYGTFDKLNPGNNNYPSLNSGFLAANNDAESDPLAINYVPLYSGHNFGQWG